MTKQLEEIFVPDFQNANSIKVLLPKIGASKSNLTVRKVEMIHQSFPQFKNSFCFLRINQPSHNSLSTHNVLLFFF